MSEYEIVAPISVQEDLMLYRPKSIEVQVVKLEEFDKIVREEPPKIERGVFVQASPDPLNSSQPAVVSR